MTDVAEDPRADCLDEQLLLDFAQGLLLGEARDLADQHLDRCADCQLELAEAVRGLESTLAVMLSQPAGTLLRAGSHIAGRYRIERFVARGGMGEVYAAHDEQLDERVALKTVSAVAADEVKAIRRLKAEVQLARRVSHPHVCRIYDFGEHELPEQPGARVHFLSMEFVEGQTLGTRLRREGGMPVAEVLQISRQLLGALAVAHGAGVLHRDFKSDNVMLRAKSPHGLGLDAIVMDFGLARALGEVGERLTSNTQALLGSAAYMAPEQVLAERELTASADIYAFGIVLFEMLTGVLPFRGDSPIATANQRLHKPAPKPSSVVPGLGQEWDELVLRCLARNARQRFQNASDVIAALPGSPERASAWHSRGRRAGALWLGGFLAGLMAAGGLIALLGAGARTPQAERDTVSLRPALPSSEAKSVLPAVPEPGTELMAAPAPERASAPQPSAAHAVPIPRSGATKPTAKSAPRLTGSPALGTMQLMPERPAYFPASPVPVPNGAVDEPAMVDPERAPPPPSEDPFDGLFVPSK